MKLLEITGTGVQYHFAEVFDATAGGEEIEYVPPSPNAERWAKNILPHAEETNAEELKYHRSPKLQPMLDAMSANPSAKLYSWSGWSDEDHVPNPSFDEEDGDENYVGWPMTVYILIDGGRQ